MAVLLTQPSNTAVVTSIQVTMQQISTTTEGLIYGDTFLTAIVIMFSLQIAAIWLLHAYCDCPYTVFLEMKVCTFWLATVSLVMSALMSTQLLVLELIGLASFRLIGHYIHRQWALRGSNIAVMINRLTDMLLLLLLAKLYWLHLRPWLSEPLYSDLLILSLSGKSITIFTWLWLPDAMEGPTPVSTLLHSATLVITGLMIYSSNTHDISTPCCVAAMSVGALITCRGYAFESDSKKICATSTCIMIFLLWIELLMSPSAMWQLALTHGYYKSSIFVLLAMLLSLSSVQDVRRIAANSIAAMLLATYVLVSLLPAGWYYSSFKTAAKYYVSDYNMDLVLPLSAWMLLLLMTAQWLGIMYSVAGVRYASSVEGLLATSTTLIILLFMVLADSILFSSVTTATVYSSLATAAYISYSLFLLFRCHQRILSLAAVLPLWQQLHSHICSLFRQQLQVSAFTSTANIVSPVCFIVLFPPPC